MKVIYLDYLYFIYSYLRERKKPIDLNDFFSKLKTGRTPPMCVSLARWLRNSCFWEALFTLSKNINWMIYTGSKWKRTNGKHATIYGIFSRKVRTWIGTKLIMADIMRMRKFLMIITSVWVKIQLNLQECLWDKIYSAITWHK